MKILLTLMFILAVGLLSGYSGQEQKIRNLKAFAKVYGYVKYFHPADETTKVDWLKLSGYGAQEVENCRTKQQLVDTLTKLFNPIASSSRFIVSNTKPIYDFREITPPKTSDYKLTYWQHFGVGTGAVKIAARSTYKSFRVNRDTVKGMDFQPKITDVFTTEICDGVYCQIPMVLYCNAESTYPKTDLYRLKSLLERVDDSFPEKSSVGKRNVIANYNLLPKSSLPQAKNLTERSDLFDLSSKRSSLMLGNVINVFNVIQHFYPYFDVVKVDWDKELEKALSRCYTDLTEKDHLITLQKFTAPLKDGHVNFQSKKRFYDAPDISWEWIEDKLALTHVSSNEKRYHVGDVVTKINGMGPEKYFEEVKSRISAGTESYLDYIANQLSLYVAYDSPLKITVNGKTFVPERKGIYYILDSKSKDLYKQIGDGICYLNVVQLTSEDLEKLLPKLVKARAIVCDARGYPKDGEPGFITHLMRSDDTTRAWMQIPYFVHPDRKNIIGYGKFNWISMMKAKKPYLGDKKIVYIIDGSAISYAESCLGYIEGYKLATIVGQPSAGTNGNINRVELLGGISFTFTGMKVLKHNSSQHHGIGIRPNIYVTKTIKGIKEGRDEFLEKAREVAKQN